MNYYELLEVSPKASSEVIHMAYKGLAKKYHPDLYKGDKTFAEEKMKQLNLAYEVLSDPVKRKAYDEKIFSSANFSHTDSFENKSTASENTSKNTDEYTANSFSNPKSSDTFENTVNMSPPHKKEKIPFYLTWPFIIALYVSMLASIPAVILMFKRLSYNKSQPDYKPMFKFSSNVKKKMATGLLILLILSIIGNSMPSEESSKTQNTTSATSDLNNISTTDDTISTFSKTTLATIDTQPTSNTETDNTNNTVSTSSSPTNTETSYSLENLPSTDLGLSKCRIVLNSIRLLKYANDYNIDINSNSDIALTINTFISLDVSSTIDDIILLETVEDGIFSNSYLKKTLNPFAGKLKYIGELKDNSPHGFGALSTLENEIVYIGNFKNGIYSGFGLFSGITDSGDLDYIYAGEFKENKFNGKGNSYIFYEYDIEKMLEEAKSEPLILEIYKDIFKNTDQNRFGEVTIGNYKNGDLNGKYKIYKDSYLYRSGNISHNLLSTYDKVKIYFPSSTQLSYEGEMKDSLYHGKGTKYNEDGKIVYSGEWENGDIK